MTEILLVRWWIRTPPVVEYMGTIFYYIEMTIKSIGLRDDSHSNYQQTYTLR